MTSLLWIRQAIKESEGTNHPVTAILQISYNATDESQKNKTTTTEDLNKNLLQKAERVLSRISAPPLKPGGPPRIFTWINGHHAPSARNHVHFVTHDTYSDLFKAEVMKAFFRQFNADHRSFGEIIFLISKPLDYLGTLIPTQFQYSTEAANEVSEDMQDEWKSK
jgi:hypothetical protein